MIKPFMVFTANSREDFWRKCIVIGKVAEERLGNQYTIPVAEHERELMTLYQPDAGTEKYLIAIRPDEQHPSEFFISWHSGDSKTLADFRKSRKQIPYMSVPIQPKPVPQPKPVAKVAPKRDIHPPRHYSPDIPQPKPKSGTVPQPKPAAKPVAVPQPKPGAKAVAVPQPKPVAKQPAANPQRRRQVANDDDDDSDSDDVPQQRRFDPGHPLQHPRDDDVPLDFLKNKSYSYIQDTIGIRGVALAKVIKEHGTSINRSREIRRNEDYDKRRERQNDREIERKIKQIERQITASELNVHNVQQNFAELKDLLGYGQEQ